MADAVFPPLPAEQRRFTTGETCRLCLVEQHTLRYWEKAFADLVTAQRIRGRRYYTRADLLTLRQINQFKQQGLTSAGILKRLQGQDAKPDEDIHAQIFRGDKIRAQLQQVIKILE